MVVELNHGDKKERVEQDMDQEGLLSGLVGELPMDQQMKEISRKDCLKILKRRHCLLPCLKN